MEPHLDGRVLLEGGLVAEVHGTGVTARAPSLASPRTASVEAAS